MTLNSRIAAHGGFGLIEMMLTIGLTLIIAMAAAPVSSSWANTARLLEAGSLLQQGYTRAKSIAISNPDAVTVPNAASILCVNSNTLYVQRSTEPLCGTNYVWSAKLSSGVILEHIDNTSGGASGAFSCAALSSLGLLIPGVLNGTTCTESAELRLTLGGKGSNVQLY